jgi:hypothetical protein
MTPQYCKALKTMRYREMYCEGEDCDECLNHWLVQNYEGEKKFLRVPIDRRIKAKGIMGKYGVSPSRAYSAIKNGFLSLRVEEAETLNQRGVL